MAGSGNMVSHSPVQKLDKINILELQDAARIFELVELVGSGLHGQSEEMSNSSSISHFFLLALADTRQLQLLHFCLFLGISLAALLGNGLIISAVACGHHLHTPMFFFLLNLAITDLGSILTTVPKAMHSSLWGTSSISYTGCAAQLFLFLFFISAEFYLLTIMCYDRYVSICKPLHYGTLLGSRACAHMAAAAWASAFLYSLLHTANTFSLSLCHGNALGQFFCEIPQILKLSCSNCISGNLGSLQLIHRVIQKMQMTAMPIDPELAAKGKPDSLMILKARPTRTQKKEPEEILTEHKETTVAQEMSTKFEKECKKIDAAWEMLEKLEAEMREHENLDYLEYRRNRDSVLIKKQE
ncbi:hypothetical protein DUI87_34782 [Hirundo rustica rustica]|uniref:Olfactory receptor n=1 Tax=Hirundo rustica rustica TaxID=333673 RepID=A0A3M0IKB4_HIRRU|nr:hypothetical protein DUI87_34782 [Hirundo rustica rustica]